MPTENTAAGGFLGAARALPASLPSEASEGRGQAGAHAEQVGVGPGPGNFLILSVGSVQLINPRVFCC